MNFNSLLNRFIISITLAIFSFPSLFAIRGYDFNEYKFYAHLTYTTIVFAILFTLFELHTYKSNTLEKILPWKTAIKKRLITEFSLSILFTPVVVTVYMVFLYDVLWEIKIWGPSLVEYNIFALTYSILMGAFVNTEVIVDEWKYSLLLNERLEKENTKARLSILQAQISPHFLFNNFNVLNALIDDNTKLAQKYLNKLSDIYRYILNQKNEELVLLSDEINFIKKYLFLLRIRFNEKLTCSISKNNFSNYYLPPATLQILVENAVKHNEISTRKPLNISIEFKNNDILVVRNNLQPKSRSYTSTEVGLKNISDRFKYFTDKQVQIIKDQKEFIVEIPIIKMDSI